MPASISFRAIQQVAELLHVDHDVPGLARAVQRLTLDESAPVTLVESVIDVGGRVPVAFPHRRSYTPAELVPVLTAESLPLVLVGAHPEGPQACVLTARRDGRLVGTVHGAAGDSAVEADAARLIEQLGWSRSEPVALLAPVRLEVSGAHGATGDERDGDHAHPTPVARMWELLRSEKGAVGLVYLYATLAGLLSLTLPLGFEFIISLVAGGLFLQPVVLLMLGVVLGTAFSGVLQVLQLSVVEQLQQRIFARIALEFSFRVPRLSADGVSRLNVPEQMNRFFEVISIQKSLGKLLTDTTTAFLTVTFGLMLLTFYHPYFTLFGIGLGLGLLLLIRWTGQRGLETGIMESKYKYRAVHWLQEMSGAMTAFKFAPRSDLALTKMDDIVGGYLKYRGKHFRVLVEQAVAMVVFKTVITGGLLIVGALLVVNKQITLGQFVASELVILLLLGGIEKLIFSFATVYDVLVAVDKLGHVRDLPLERMTGLPLPSADAGVGIEAREVTFTYPGAPEPSIRDLSLRIGAGERVAVTGCDGSGESTLLRLLAGMHDQYGGVLTVDGRTLRDLDASSYRAQVGQYLSSTDLFDGTVEENVSVGRRTVGPDEVQDALEVAGALAAVQAMPQGANTPLADSGRTLASSLRARLLFAQAIAGRPRLLLCDEFFDQLDLSLRRRVKDVLTDRRRPWTVVAVSHDPEFLAACDRVIVLRDGRVHAVGPFAEVADDPYLKTVLPVVTPAVSASSR